MSKKIFAGQINIEAGTGEALSANTKLPTITRVKELVKPVLEPVKSSLDFTTSEPASPSANDRHINTVTGLSSVTSQSMTINYIYEYEGSFPWIETIPTPGDRVYNEAISAWLEYTGSAWEVDTGDLKQNNFYAAADAGSDSAYDGRSYNEAFKTFAFAIATASPGPSNPIAIDGIDGAVYDEDLTIPSYVIINAPKSTFIGNNIIAANATFIARSLQPANRGTKIAITKSTPGNANVYIMEAFSNVDGVGGTLGLDGAKCTSGSLHITAGSATYLFANSLIGKDSNGDITFVCDGRITTDGNAKLVDLNSTGKIHCKLNGDVIGTSSTIFNATSSGGRIYVEGTAISADGAGGKIANATNGAKIRVFAITTSESAKSTYDSSSEVTITSLNLPTIHRGNEILYYFSEVVTGYGSDVYMYDYQYHIYQSYLITISAQGTQVYYAATTASKPEYNLLHKGVHTITIRARKNSGTSDAQLYAELVTINGYGVGHTVTVQAISELTPILTGTATQYDLHCILQDDVVIPVGDRMQIRIKGNYVGVALDAEVEFIIGLTGGAGSAIFSGARILGSMMPVTDSRYVQLTKAAQTITGNVTVTGTAAATTVSATTVSATTVGGTNVNSTNLTATNINSTPTINGDLTVSGGANSFVTNTGTNSYVDVNRAASGNIAATRYLTASVNPWSNGLYSTANYEVRYNTSVYQSIATSGVMGMPGIYGAVAAGGALVYCNPAGIVGTSLSITAAKMNINTRTLEDVQYIFNLRVVDYNFKKQDENYNFIDEPEPYKEYGFLLEEVKAENVDLVDEFNRNIFYQKVFVDLVKVVQDHETRLSALEAQ